MKSLKKALVVGACLMALCFALNQEVPAADAWYECQVNMLGQMADGSVILLLTHVGSTWPGTKWFNIPQAKSKEFMAVILTAISCNKNVTAMIDLNQAQNYPDVKGLTINN
ncbi:MAG: hypothetical protein FJ128_03230 [Deltaproteobacteria bacterium]|nr:hypothetical protein [Deltaproteobacteria bacterium]